MTHTPFKLLYANAAGLTVREIALLLGSGWSQSTVRRHARVWLAGGYVSKVGARFVITARGIVMCLRHTRLIGYIPPVLRRAA